MFIIFFYNQIHFTMQEDKYYCLVAGAFYSQNYLREFKDRLQIKKGYEILEYQNQTEFSFSCSNQKKHNCSFICLFTKKMDVESKDLVYYLQKFDENHSFQCQSHVQSLSFQKAGLLITDSKHFITDIILKRYQMHGPENPKKLLQIVSGQLGFDEPFIYKGLVDIQLKRKIKKKFDNMVANIRRQHNLKGTINASSYLIKRKSKKLYFNMPKLQLTESDNQKEEFDKTINDLVQIDCDSSFDSGDFFLKNNRRKYKNREKKNKTKQKTIKKKPYASDDLIQNHYRQVKTQITQLPQKRKWIRKSIAEKEE